MAQLAEQKAGNAKVRVSLLTFKTFWSCVFLYFISLIVTSKTFQTWNSTDKGLIQISFCCISNEHLQKRGIKKLDRACFRFIFKKFDKFYVKVVVKMVEWWSIKHKVVGSTPTQVNFWWLFLKFFFLSFTYSWNLTFIRYLLQWLKPA